MFRLGKISKRDLYLTSVFFVGLLVVATGFYRFVEGWSWIDSFYFSATTLMTIGHAELIPSTDLSKLFTVVLAFAGITTFLVLIALIAEAVLRSERS